MIKIGTSGYSYQDWIGPFYPEGTKKADMLSFYAGEFDFTEINSTYYSIPNPFMMNHILKKTPESFEFSIKLHSSMTHSRDANEAVYKQFIEAVKPLNEAKKLSCLIAQFPFSFHYNTINVDYIKNMRDLFHDFPLAIEWRNNQWICQSAFELLKGLNISFICVDEPDVKGLVKPLTIVTNSLSYIRFHGRNKDKWYHHNAPYERYDYLYSNDELKEWIPRINNMKKYSERVYIAFNNHFRAQSVRNVQMLKNLLSIP